MTKTFKLFVVLAAASSLVAGCSSGGAKKAATPKEAVKNLSAAIENSDKALFLSTVHIGPDDKEFAETMFDAMAAMMGFGKDMEKAYGKDAGGEMTKDSPVLSEEELAKLEVKEDGDKATAKSPKGGKPMSLVKKDGAWLVDMTAEMPKGEDRAKALKQAKAMTKVIGEVRAKIGKAGMTKEKIGEEFMGALMKAGTST